MGRSYACAYEVLRGSRAPAKVNGKVRDAIVAMVRKSKRPENSLDRIRAWDLK